MRAPPRWGGWSCSDIPCPWESVLFPFPFPLSLFSFPFPFPFPFPFLFSLFRSACLTESQRGWSRHWCRIPAWRGTSAAPNPNETKHKEERKSERSRTRVRPKGGQASREPWSRPPVSCAIMHHYMSRIPMPPCGFWMRFTTTTLLLSRCSRGGNWRTNRRSMARRPVPVRSNWVESDWLSGHGGNHENSCTVPYCAYIPYSTVQERKGTKSTARGMTELRHDCTWYMHYLIRAGDDCCVRTYQYGEVGHPLLGSNPLSSWPSSVTNSGHMSSMTISLHLSIRDRIGGAHDGWWMGWWMAD